MRVTEVRRYHPGDRPAVEDIACRTGFMGESPEVFWRHRPSFVSTWVAPYLDQQPESTLVATVDGRVIGYLTGCLVTADFEGPDAMLAKAIARHWLLFRNGVARFLWRAIADRILDKWRGYPPVSGELHDARWPSHLHINLLPEARGSGLGRALMKAWFARLRDLGSPGCHLGVIAETARGRILQGDGFRAAWRAAADSRDARPQRRAPASADDGARPPKRVSNSRCRGDPVPRRRNSSNHYLASCQ